MSLDNGVLMVIFGAGASYDSDPLRSSLAASNPHGPEERRLPLAVNLFHRRFGRYVWPNYDACIPLLKRLRERAPAIEPELEAIRNEAARSERAFMLRQLEAVRYYIRALIEAQQEVWLGDMEDHRTNYIDLVQDLQSWRLDYRVDLALLTFNYDTLLDAACRSVIPELRLDRVIDYAASEHEWLFKLHGSTEWLQRVNVPPELKLQRTAKDAEAQMIDWAGRYAPTDDYFKRDEGQYDLLSVVPALAIPMVTKSGEDFSCPRAHLDRLREVMPYVTRILAIGWRGEEQHFADLWLDATQGSRRVRQIMAVDATSEGAKAVADRLNETLQANALVSYEGGGFTGAMQAGRIAEWLKLPT